MAATLHFFAQNEDERALFRVLGPHGLVVYPELSPPGYQPFTADEAALPRLDGPAYYLAAERLGPVVAHPVKRGPNKGLWEIEEVRSPVFHYERSLPNEAGELVAGRIWAELDITDDPESHQGKPRALRHIFEELHHFLRKSFRRSDPKGYWVGPRAHAAWKGGLVLREPGHKGRTYGVWR
jgi:hypothetical protein